MPIIARTENDFLPFVTNDYLKAPCAMVSSSEVIPIERPTLHAIVVSRIRDMVIEGSLPAGVRIHEGQLGEQLGISRTPLREALKVLASEGLVELIPSRGAVVTTLTPKAAQDMLDVLKQLEAMAAPLICQHASDEDIREIRRLHHEMLGFYANRSRLEYFKLNLIAFYFVRAKISGFCCFLVIFPGVCLPGSLQDGIFINSGRLFRGKTGK